MVRCCHKCKEYIIIDPSNPNNQKLIKSFEKTHIGHAVGSANLSEVKDSYENVEEQLKSDS